MNYTEAMEAVKSGIRVTRSGWHIDGTWLKIDGAVTVREMPVGHPARPDGCVMVWGAKAEDRAADDWISVDPVSDGEPIQEQEQEPSPKEKGWKGRRQVDREEG